jgi:hypothetical protein
MATPILVTFRLRRDTAANWTAANPVLKLGEPGLETDTRKVKYGDGATAWNALAYSAAGAVAWADVTGKPAFGTLSTQNANAVAITGGSFTGASALGVVSATIAPLTLNGGTGSSQGSYVQGQRGGAGSWFVGDVGLALGSGNGLMLYAYGSNPVYLHGTALRPDTDNAMDLGAASNRFAVVYAGTGTINTSDARDKRDVGEIPDEWLDAWADVEWSRYRFKGGDRWHVGLVAQQVRDAFAARGLDACEIGLLCFDEWEARPAVRARKGSATTPAREAQPGRKAGDRWGLRYDECQAMEAAWVRRELSRLSGRRSGAQEV